ncbi:hypothetical protein VNO80_01259 [Phaseolus coccineus]|uniref:Uncharacterized protein n=1 Tax=Phaseolus coccineus TaxID=3886 RepID=A0AAN9WW80_PHACN
MVGLSKGGYPIWLHFEEFLQGHGQGGRLSVFLRWRCSMLSLLLDSQSRMLRCVVEVFTDPKGLGDLVGLRQASTENPYSAVVACLPITHSALWRQG